MASIVTLTSNPTIDLSWDIDRLDAEGKVRAEARSITAGGGGINVARGVGRLGGSATAVHTAGGDTGRRLDHLLDAEGVDHRAVPIAEETREALVLFETGADRSFHIVPGGPSVSEEEGRRCLDALVEVTTAGDHVVLSGSLPEGLADDFYATVAGRVKGCGARVVLDSSGSGLQDAADEGVHVLKLNRREAGALLGRTVEDFGDARVSNDRLLERGAAEIVVTTVGDKGALCSTDGGHVEVGTPPLPGPVRSDAGAGDGFAAALTHRLNEGDDATEACRLAVAAAAASVLTPGTELFDPAQVERLHADVTIHRRTGPLGA